MSEFHRLLTVTTGMHPPLGTSLVGDATLNSGKLSLEPGVSDALVWDDGAATPVEILRVTTASAIPAVIHGDGTYGNVQTFIIPDGLTFAFTIEDESSNDYFSVRTAAERIVALGNATTNPAVQIHGTNDLRLGSQIRFTERAGDPSNVANCGFVYTKDVSAATELFYEDSAGNVVQITSGGALAGGGGGANTLDDAYDEGGAGAGRSITVDSGAVELSGTGTVLEVGQNGVTTNGDPAIRWNDGTGVAARYATLVFDAADDNGRLRASIDNGTVVDVVLSLDGENGGILVGSSPNTPGSDAVQVGYNASAGGVRAVAVGPTTSASGNDAICVGTGSASVVGARSVGIGRDCVVSGTDCVAVGADITINAAHDESIALGRNATTSAAQQMMVGSTGEYITDVCIGGGDTDGNARTLTLRPSSGTSTAAGWDLTLQAGAGGSTSGNGGDLTLAGGTVTSGTAGQVAVQVSGATRWLINASGVEALAGTAGGDTWFRNPFSTSISNTSWNTVWSAAIGSNRSIAVRVVCHMFRGSATTGAAMFHMVGAAQNLSGTTTLIKGSDHLEPTDGVHFSERTGGATTQDWRCRITVDDTADEIRVQVISDNANTIAVDGVVEWTSI